MQLRRQLLGIYERKEYYLVRDLDRAAVQPWIEWRIPDIRESVRAEPGMKILGSDLSQIEVKLMAHLSQDPALMAAINKGGDIHCYMAVDIFGEEYGFDYETIVAARKQDDHPRHDELVRLRSDTKTLTFGIPYGAGAPRVASETGKTHDEAQALIDRYFSRYHVLHDWLEEQGRRAVREGFSRSVRGHMRFYIVPHQDMENKLREQLLGQIHRWAGNQPIQSSNVDILKPAMFYIYRRFREEKFDPEDARIIFVVHDEIVCTARDALVPQVEVIMKEEMQRAYVDVIPDIINDIKVSIGYQWEKD